MAAPAPGARITQGLRLDIAAVGAGATMVGDFNPLHHDAAFAARSRFGGIFASGAHTSALLCGLASKNFGDEAADGRGSVGVEYSVQFRAPVRVDRDLRMEWTVASVEPRRSGTIARLEGKIVDIEDDVALLTAKMTLLYFA